MRHVTPSGKSPVPPSLLLLLLCWLLCVLLLMGGLPSLFPHTPPSAPPRTIPRLLPGYTSYPVPSDELLPACHAFPSHIEGTGLPGEERQVLLHAIEQDDFSVTLVTFARTPYTSFPSFLVHEAILFRPVGCMLLLVVDVARGWLCVVSGPASPLREVHQDAAQGVFMQEYRRQHRVLPALLATLTELRHDFLWDSPLSSYAFE